ncbi:hypothetical protein [Sphingomonas sp. 37zxx]|uniref:hypothetical protein n=1 Tax=Sphingomonas sp. 37zxx TaxID=1550073 RepID=UPI00053BFC10|nr:hypothetical protein [Sphingomonas sp. 37zxx]
MAAGIIAGFTLSIAAIPGVAVAGSIDDPQPFSAASAASGPELADTLPRIRIFTNAQRNRDVVAGFRVTQVEPRQPEIPRIDVLPDTALDLSPGDRGIDIAAGTHLGQQRRREPGATVDARMSMRLDPGSRSDPDFGMGGIGGALMRMTSALID